MTLRSTLVAQGLRGEQVFAIGGAVAADPIITMPSLRAVGAGNSGASSAVIAAPAGLASGDVEIMLAECIQTETISDPATWTALSVSPQTGAATKLQAWYRRWNGSDGNPTLSGVTNHVVGIRVAFKDCIASGDPIDAIAGATAASSTAVSFPTITTLTANCYVVNLCAAGTDTATPQSSGEANASLSGVAELADFFAIDGGGGGVIAIGGGKAAAGAVSATTATLATASSQGLITLALKGAVS